MHPGLGPVSAATLSMLNDDCGHILCQLCCCQNVFFLLKTSYCHRFLRTPDVVQLLAKGGIEIHNAYSVMN